MIPVLIIFFIHSLLDLPPKTIKIGQRFLTIKKVRENVIRPGHKFYKKCELSTRPFDLKPLNPKLISGHVLVDDVLVKIFLLLGASESIRLEIGEYFYIFISLHFYLNLQEIF